MHIIQNHIPGIAHSNRRYTTQILFRESPTPMEDTYIYISITIHINSVYYICCKGPKHVHYKERYIISIILLIPKIKEPDVKAYMLCYISGVHKTNFYKVGPLPNHNRRKGSIGRVLWCARIKGWTRSSYMPQFIANRIRVPNCNRNFPIDRTTFVICCDWSGGPDPVICGS